MTEPLPPSTHPDGSVPPDDDATTTASPPLSPASYLILGGFDPRSPLEGLWDASTRATGRIFDSGPLVVSESAPGAATISDRLAMLFSQPSPGGNRVRGGIQLPWLSIPPAAAYQPVQPVATVQPRSEHTPESDYTPVDLQPVSVLTRAVRQAKSVCCILKANGETGTGCLVGDDLLLTSAHVLPDIASANGATARFNFEDGEDDASAEGGIDEYRLDTATFISSPYRSPEDGGVDADHLDYTLVDVKRRGRRSASQVWGTSTLASSRQYMGVNQDVFIVHHPGGDKKMVTLARNQICEAQPLVFYYVTDTLPGSSGAPVLDQSWSVIGLHRGTEISMSGGKQWIANVAVDIWAILRDISSSAKSRLKFSPSRSRAAHRTAVAPESTGESLSRKTTKRNRGAIHPMALVYRRGYNPNSSAIRCRLRSPVRR
jgi:V8-like Glu-specific endopeptidase